MGGHNDDESYDVNKQKQDEELKNKLNEGSHWCDQDSIGNHAKRVKEGRNQLRKVAENQQDQDHNCNINQNGNKEDFPLQNITQEKQQGNEEQTKSPKIAMTPGLSQEESKNILNEPLLINALESEEEKDKEREEDDKEKDSNSEVNEETSDGGRGEQPAEQSNAESQREGGVVGRNTCLLFSNMNATPSDEETSWPSSSQDNSDNSPNGNRGNPQVYILLTINCSFPKFVHLALEVSQKEYLFLCAVPFFSPVNMSNTLVRKFVGRFY